MVYIYIDLHCSVWIKQQNKIKVSFENMYFFDKFQTFGLWIKKNKLMQKSIIQYPDNRTDGIVYGNFSVRFYFFAQDKED